MTLINVLLAEARRFISAASRIGTIVNFASGFPTSSGAFIETTDIVDFERVNGGGISSPDAIRSNFCSGG